MGLFSGILIYVLIWWMVFFCSLPFGLRHADKPEPGMMNGAPTQTNLKRKFLISFVISAVIWVIIYLIIRSNLISYHDIAARMRT